MERDVMAAEPVDRPFCGCPTPLPSSGAEAVWRAAVSGAFGRMAPQNGPILA